MTSYERTLLILIILFTSFNLNAQLAFPSAVGAGAYATGGRGGAVIHVTNLNNSGPGSFREAFTTPGPRIIVFDVSGTINVYSSLSTAYDDVTIAGQTAPEGGITFTGNLGNSPIFEISGRDNMIFRYIRVRPEYYYGGSNADAFQGYNCTNVVVDHCSVSWGGDECLSFGGNTSNISVQNTIIAESKTGSIMGNPSTPSNAQNLSMVGNLFFQISRRHPNTPTNGRVDVVNNVIWGYRYRTNRPANGRPRLNEINNYYITDTGRPFGEMNKIDWEGVVPQIYTKGNLHIPNSVTDPNLPNNNNTWTAFGTSNGAYAFNYNGQAYYDDDPAPDDFFTSVQHPIIGENWNILTALEALEHAKTDVGANKSLNAAGDATISWDSVDDFYVNHVNNGTYLTVSSGLTMAGKQHYENFLNSVTTTPINTRPSDYDTDNDGMADQWEINNYGNLNNNGLSDTDNNGYMDIEDFINEVDNASTAGSQVSVSSNATNDAICEGEDVTLTASGADAYLWNTGATTASITVSPASTATYTVTGTHSDNSTSEDSITITVNTLPNADAGADVETCEGTAVTLSATGGTSYQWNTGSTSQSIVVNPNTTTTYSVQVTQNGCTSTDSVVVTVNEQPTVDAGSDQTIFMGESAVLTATGADSYLWSTGETTQSITVNPVLDTSYSVTGTIGNCESTDTVTVFLLDDSVSANAGDDAEICDGESITLTASGGTTYLWDTGATTASISVSPNTTTTYTVTVFSPSGNNTDTDSVVVTVNEIPTVDAGADVTINSGEDVTLTATGADTYLWSTGATTASITVSPNTTITYNVTGFSNGCEATDSVTVTVNAETITANAGNDVAICVGETTTLTATGGTLYLWSTGETTQSIQVSPTTTTTYTVTASNASQTVSDTDDVVVTVNDLPEVNGGNDVTIIENESTTLTASGADSYLWSTGETTTSISVSPNSTTTFTVTGFLNGCEATDDVTVTVNIETVSADAGEDVTICTGESATLTASGGTTYLWSNGETTASITVTPNSTITYSVTAFNTNQTASDSDDVTVNVNALPNTSAGSDVTIIEGESTTLSATGADSYLWNTGETTATIQVNPQITTTYSVTGFNNGCESTDEVTVIVEPFEFTASAGGDQVICQGYETTLTASEGDSYLWSTGDTTQSITVNPSNTQTYTVTVFLGEYQDDADVTVSVNPNPIVVIANGDQVDILEGEFITLSASGANSYLWNNGATQPNIAVSPAVTTTYEVTGFINNCEDTKAVVVNVFESVIADAGEDVTICLEETVTLTATGGDEYLWNTGETTPTIEVSPESDTEYSVLVYNALSSDEAFVTVFVEECSAAQLPPENDSFDFLVFQDTTQDILKVKINGLQSVNAKGITIYDISGKVLHNETFRQAELENESEMLKEINTTPYARGIYVVRLDYNDTSVIKKIPIR